MKKNMNLQQRLNSEKLESLKGQLAYCEERINEDNIEAWEIKEYTQTANNIKKEIINLTNLIKQTT